MMKVLVTGWFSFEGMGATAGDLLSRDVACAWLRKAGCAFDVATAPPFTGGVDWDAVEPDDYSHVVFVCGPFGNGWPITDFLERFHTSRLVGLNLSMLDTLDRWNPFDLLLERDSSRTARPDLSFLSEEKRVPVVGRILAHKQKEYGKNGRHEEAHAAIARLADSYEAAIVDIDTRLDVNGTGLRTPAEVESLIARMDVVLTTRLHGTVLALKNGVPALAIDPIAGGAKIRRQAETLGWPVVFSADALDDETLSEAFAYCRTEDARERARAVAMQARGLLAEAERTFLGEFTHAEAEEVV